MVASAGAEVVRLRAPNDRELRSRLSEQVSAVAIVDRDDITALRLALLVEYLRPGARLLVTIFDRTVSDQLKRAVPNCRVMSLADAVAPAFSGACMAEKLLSAGVAGGPTTLRRGEDGLEISPALPAVPAARVRLARLAAAQFRPHDRSSRLLLAAIAGLAGLIGVETALGLLALDESPVDAFYGAVKTVATIGPNPAMEEGPWWAKLYASGAFIAGTVLTALLTAGVVNRLVSSRLTGIIGTRTVPRRDHVVVVGLGQVGLRVCLELRRAGLDVVAVERDPESPHVRTARNLGIPVVIGRGGDRFLLQRLSLTRARALAAVTSDELGNVAVAVAALAVEPDLRVVLRAGDNDVTRETRSLFPIGTAIDVFRLAGACLTALALGYEADHAVGVDGRVLVRLVDGELLSMPTAPAHEA